MTELAKLDSDPNLSLVRAIKDHIVLCSLIIAVIGLVIHIVTIGFLLERIDSVRCTCTPLHNVEANGNHIHLSQRTDPAEQLAREILESQGKITHASNVPGTVRPESSKGSRTGSKGSPKDSL